MKIKPINFSKLTYINNKKISIIKETRNPIRMGQFFDLYLKGRKEIPNLWYIILHVDYAYENLHKLRFLKDNKILAGYTYKLRHNRLGERSLYIDGLAKDLKNPKSKNIMPKIYSDIKNTALKHKAKEITLFVYAQDKHLKNKYESLGFKQDTRTKIEDLDLMRVRTDDFLNNKYFKTLQYKSVTGIKSILQKLQK